MRRMLLAIVLLTGVVAMPRAWAAAEPIEFEQKPKICDSIEQLKRESRMNRIEIFLDVDAKPSDVAVLRRAIKSSPDVKRYTFLDHKAALKEFTRLFRRDPDLIKNTRASDLPESFRITAVSRASMKNLMRRLKRLPKVESVLPPTPVDPAMLLLCAAGFTSPGR